MQALDIFKMILTIVRLSGPLYHALPSDEVTELPAEQLLRKKIVDDASFLSLWKHQFVDAFTVL